MAQSSGQQEIVKLPEMSSEEIEHLLSSQKICRMALNDRPQPYIIALDYIYDDGEMYFHFADYGRKMDLIKNDPHVSVEVDDFCAEVPNFSTITLMGELVKVTSKAEKERAARDLRDTAEQRGGAKNVAARHGFTDLDMETLTSRRSAVYRLEARDYVALKSPGR
ncbi:MAG: Pyridoxamine 5'-phosphate oxidase [Methanocella sp. PtaU1.Bin125]|nr:MAG: Pyridoxamine 5'-phosphate oxidase [Methanocella sp. PtaU1.Bin125]